MRLATAQTMQSPSATPAPKPSAPSKHQKQTDLVNWIVNEGVARGVGHLSLDDVPVEGRTVSIRGKTVVNFGSASYLGLERDPRLADAAAEAAKKYGTQISSSRAYVASCQYPELETLLGRMFEAHCLVTPSTTLAHLAALPTMIQEGDIVLVDHEAHSSLKMASDVVKARGVTVELIAHNSMEKLEEKILELRSTHKNIWYIADGIYSMHGDLAPFTEIEAMLNKHEQLRVYIDDAHGMSWSGKNGRGSALGTIALHERMVVALSLSKAFGCGGGVLVFPTEKQKQNVRNCGAPLIFSGPLQPPTLGAAIASAKLHLSGELEAKQEALRARIQHCIKELKAHNLPVASFDETPVFFVRVGLPTVGANLMKRMFDSGYYMNVGVFPAVALRDTGMRFSINCHQTFEDITNMVKTMAEQLPLASKEEMSTTALLRNALKLGASNLLTMAKGT